jgi:hypothetical protein
MNIIASSSIFGAQWLRLFSLSLLVLTLQRADGFQITNATYSNQVFRAQFQATTNSYYELPLYYALFRGSDVLNITQSVASVAASANGQLTDTNSPLPNAFYRVRQIGVAALAATTNVIFAQSTSTLTLTLDHPAPVGGAIIPLTLTPANAGSFPPTVPVSEGQTSVTFEYVDSGTTTNVTLAAILGESIATTSLTTVPFDTSHLVINEVDYDNIGTDTAEFAEIFNPSTNAVSLANLALILVNGSNNTEYRRVNLTGSLAAQGYLVVANPGVTVAGGATVINFSLASDNIQNGAPDAVLLFDTLNHRVVDALSYEGAITAAILTGEPGVFNLVEGTAFTTADSNTANASLSRAPNGADTDNASSDWRLTTTPTPGAPNVP